MFGRPIVVGIAVGLGLVVAGCGSSASTGAVSGAETAACAAGTVQAGGSTALQPLVDKAGKAYATTCNGAAVTVNGTGSSAGLQAVAQGAVDIGMSDFPVSDATGLASASLVDHPVAIVVFAVVANPNTGVTNLTTAQLRSIFSGQTTNWSQVGGYNVSISVVERKAGSGTRLSFDKDMMGSTSQTATPASTQSTSALVLQAVGNTPGAISYLSNADATSAVTTVPIDGVTPSATHVQDGTYPFFAHEHCYTSASPSAATASFLGYLTTTYQSQVSANGFLPLSATTRQAAVDH